MATFKENKTAEKTKESTIPEVDSSSSNSKSFSQRSLFARLFPRKESSNLTSEEPTAKSSSVCPQCEADERHQLISRRASSEPGSSTLSHHCVHNHNCPTPDHSFDGQNLATSASISADEQSMTQEKQPDIPTHSPANTKLKETKSKTSIKVSKTTQSSSNMTGSATNCSASSPLIDKRSSLRNRISMICQFLCLCCFKSLKENATVENSTQVTTDQENHECFDIVVNRNDDQTLLEASNHNDCNTNDIMTDETTSNILCIDTQQSDIIEIKEKENAKVLCSMSIHEDLSVSNKEDDDHSEIINNVGQTEADIIEHKVYDSPMSSTMVSQCDQSNEFRNDTFPEFMKKQEELKVYYNNFPNIEDAMNETGPDIKKAKEFTKSILGNLPSGDVKDRSTACHVLNKMFGNEQQDCLFYDSKNGIELHDAFQNVADINSQKRPFVLKLSSSEGLGNIKQSTTAQDDLELTQTLTNIIEQEGSHPVLKDVIERLAKAHGVNKEDIVIENVYVGTLNFVYTVKNSSGNNAQSTSELKQKLKNQFDKLVSAKIHPLLCRVPSFDIAYFDSRGNKTFPKESTTFDVGPSGSKKPYTTPSEWTRYGLKVLGKYENDYWLHPFQHPQNWYRAFHGTKNAQNPDFGEGNKPSDSNYACVDALSSIYLQGFTKARTKLCGDGVYCSPNPQFPERDYVRAVSIDTEQGRKSFKCMLQVAVNPNNVKCKNKDIWVVPDPKDIRPYGILIKEA